MSTAVFKIPVHIANYITEIFAAAKNGATIQVVDDIWISTADALEKLGVRRDYLKWLCDNDHLSRRLVDKKNYEYDPVKVQRLKRLLKAGKFILPPVNSLYKK